MSYTTERCPNVYIQLHSPLEINHHTYGRVIRIFFGPGLPCLTEIYQKENGIWFRLGSMFYNRLMKWLIQTSIVV